MAHRDLDAALQLLAERAQYITEASGAAIALRRGEHNDMLCRASAGSNAPELGALLSMEYGLSGESVRTRQILRCDDTERDSRVNREGCRQLGIASVVVMPIANEQQVLGVFELFSGKPRAFDERDISALQRLSEMVETAVNHATAAQTAAMVEEPAGEEAQLPAEDTAADVATIESAVSTTDADVVAPPPVKPLSPTDVPPSLPVKIELEKQKPEPAPKGPLFWSAAVQSSASAARPEDVPQSIAVPPVLRNLQKCQACGFPVSQGRTFCVECEEKQWRGQRLPAQKEPASKEVALDAPAAAAPPKPENAASVPVEPAGNSAPVLSSAEVRDLDIPASDVPDPANVPSDTSTLFLSSTASSESWLSANKYILGALLVVAIVIGAVVWLR